MRHTYANVLCGVILSLAFTGPLQAASSSQEWPYFGGSHRFDRYSPLSRINASNVGRLSLLWERPSVDKSITDEFPDVVASPYHRGTPIMLDGVLYSPNGIGLVEAFDALTGKTIWVQKPFKATFKEVVGQSSRGVDVWRDGKSMRIFSVRGEYLYALNANDGSLITAFGEGGRVLLRRQTKDNAPFFSFNGPIVVRDVIVVGGNGGGKVGQGYGDYGLTREAAPENVRAYDVRTGKLRWTFEVMPRVGTPERATWGNAADYTGNMSAWAPLSADDATGYVYVPLSSPTNPNFGGHRPGDNLYANCLVALDSRTGTLVWKFQTVHHDLWDFDNASPPTLADLKVDGKVVKAVIQPNKTGFVFVLDRRTGKPVWPIEERPVPQSTVPGEHSSPTQPFPTRPEPFDVVGSQDENLVDFTPELRAEAITIRNRYVHGDIFTPPSVSNGAASHIQGSFELPGSVGAGNWNTGAFDPQTGRYYAVSTTAPDVLALVEARESEATIGYHYDNTAGPDYPEPPLGVGPQHDIPITKPPYGRITAYDMNEGRRLWVVANGDGPREHPLLKDLKLPPLGTPGRPVALVTQSLLFLGESSAAVFGSGVPGPSHFRAYDKATGRVIASVSLPAGTTGGPITYEVKGKQIIVVPIGSTSHGSSWVALGLP